MLLIIETDPTIIRDKLENRVLYHLNYEYNEIILQKKTILTENR